MIITDNMGIKAAFLNGCSPRTRVQITALHPFVLDRLRNGSFRPIADISFLTA
jgi:hypothetical protein